MFQNKNVCLSMSPNEIVDDEIEEGLEAFQFPVEAEYENNNYLTRSVRKR